MPRPCLTCIHDDREAIDHDLVAGSPLPHVASRYGLSESSLKRHKAGHLSPALVTAVRDEDGQRRAKSLLDRIEWAVGVCERIIEAAERDGRPATAISGVRELHGLLRTVGNVTGEIAGAPQVTLNVLQSDDFLRAVATINAALAPYPEARFAVARALSGHDTPALPAVVDVP